MEKVDTRKPTVTELLDLLNKPALLKWANKIGLEGQTLQEAREKSFLLGNNYHGQIENYLKHGKKFEDNDFFRKFEEFIAGKTVVASEQSVEHKDFIGKFDVKLRIGSHEYLCDFKTSRGVWFETILQLVAYNMVEKADYMAVINVPTFKMRTLYISELQIEYYESIISHLASIYKLKSKILSINPYY